MNLTLENFAQANYDVFSLFHNRWALLTAGTPEDYNTMTIGWGSMGTVWSKPVITVYVRENRYTYEFMERHPIFTVSFFPESARKALATLGRLSGRDGDKIAAAGLTPVALDGAVGFAEAELTFRCSTLYAQPFDRTQVPQQIIDRYYADDDTIHHLYIAQVEDVIGTIGD